MYLLIIPEPKK